MPRVSVLLPVRDGGRSLLLAVWSILEQSLSNWELLVLDDGSSDDAVLRVERIGDARVRVMHDSARMGLAARLNRGIALARGEMLARMDHDDLAFPSRLQRQLEFLEREPEVDLLGTRAVVFSGDGTPMGLFPFRQTHEAICRRPWMGFYLPHPTWMGRASWFRRHGYRMPESRRAEDQELLLRTYTNSRFACLPEVLLGYRASAVSLSKVLAARASVGRSQLREHAYQRRLHFALLGAGVSVAKAGMDVASTIAGRKLYSARSLEPIADPALWREWMRLWHTGNAWLAGSGAAQ